MIDKHIINAVYDFDTLTVYQAYNPKIAESAVLAQTFTSPPFKKERMTWIKPSFLWTMYRSGWATKENQECVLAIQIKRSGFEWALSNSCLSSYDHKIFQSQEDWKKSMEISPVRIQWDPERDIFLRPLPYTRSLQVGLSSIAVVKYITDWIVKIEDITSICRQVSQLITENRISQATELLPVERQYILPDFISQKIGVTI